MESSVDSSKTTKLKSYVNIPKSTKVDHQNFHKLHYAYHFKRFSTTRALQTFKEEKHAS